MTYLTGRTFLPLGRQSDSAATSAASDQGDHYFEGTSHDCFGHLNDAVLAPVKARNVHGISANGKIFTELFGCLACLYSR